MTRGGAPRKRGRPPGVPSLTPAMADDIVTYVRGGASLAAAARMLGLLPRTVQDWAARGEGRSTGSATPKLRDFAKRIRKAQGEALGSAQVRVHELQPATWLRLEAAASSSEPSEAGEPPSPENLQELARRVRDLLLVIDPTEVVPRCTNPKCRCVYHRQRTDEEAAALKAVAATWDDSRKEQR